MPVSLAKEYVALTERHYWGGGVGVAMGVTDTIFPVFSLQMRLLRLFRVQQPNPYIWLSYKSCLL
jgi:hypothetical protein